MEEDLLPFDRAARDARLALDEFGPVARRLEALYDDAHAVEQELMGIARSRGQPGQTDMRGQMEWNLLGLWMQMLGQFRAEFLRSVLVQGSEITAAPRVSIADPRELRNHRPDRGRIGPLN